MDRWHCLYHCTAGSSTSLIEIRTYDPKETPSYARHKSLDSFGFILGRTKYTKIWKNNFEWIFYNSPCSEVFWTLNISPCSSAWSASHAAQIVLTPV